MRFNKRGISAVVATTLTVLLSVVAVSIVWIGIDDQIGEEAFESSIESKASINIIEGYTVWDPDNETLSVQVEVSEIGSSTPIAIDFIFEVDGNSIKRRITEVPGENSRQVFYFNMSGLGKPDEIAISFVYENGESSPILSRIEVIPEGDLDEVLVGEEILGVGDNIGSEEETEDFEDEVDNFNGECVPSLSPWDGDFLESFDIEDTYCSGGGLCNHGYCHSNGTCMSPYCKMVINEPNIKINLDSNLVCDIETSGEEVFLVNAENFSLDCRGNSIYSTATFINEHNPSIFGLYINYGADNYLVENCNISHFRKGIENRGANLYGTIRNNIFSDSAMGTFEHASSSRNTYVKNVFYDLGYGVLDDEGGYFTFICNEFVDNNIGIGSGSRNTNLLNYLENNTFYNSNTAIDFFGGGSSTIKGNYFINNNKGIMHDQFSVHSSGNYVLEDNIFSNNFVSSVELFFHHIIGTHTSTSYCNENNCKPSSWEGNIIDGNEYLYLEGESGGEYSGEYGGIICRDCSNLIFRDITIDSPGHVGMEFYNSNNISIEGTNTIANQETGIRLLKSYNVNVSASFSGIGSGGEIVSLDSYLNTCNGGDCPGETCVVDADCTVSVHVGDAIPLYRYGRICNFGQCVPECITDIDCSGNPLGNLCLKNSCVGCVEHSDCVGAGEICWWDNTCQSFGCSVDSDCEDYNDCSVDTCNGGFCEFSEITPTSNCYHCVGVISGQRHYADYSMGRLYGGVDFNHDGVFDEMDNQNPYLRTECDIDINPFCDYTDGSRNLVPGGQIHRSELPIPQALNAYGTTCLTE